MAVRSTPLDDLLGTQSKVRALRVRFSTTQPLSGREIARQAGMSKTPVGLALAQLLRRGVVMLPTLIPRHKHCTVSKSRTHWSRSCVRRSFPVSVRGSRIFGSRFDRIVV